MLDEQQTLRYVRLAKQGDKHAKEILFVENTSLLKCIVSVISIRGWNTTI